MQAKSHFGSLLVKIGTSKVVKIVTGHILGQQRWGYATQLHRSIMLSVCCCLSENTRSLKQWTPTWEMLIVSSSISSQCCAISLKGATEARKDAMTKMSFQHLDLEYPLELSYDYEPILYINFT